MLFSGIAVEPVAAVGERLGRKTRSPIATAAIIKTAAPIIAHLKPAGFVIGSEIVSIAFVVFAVFLNFSGIAGFPSSSV